MEYIFEPFDKVLVRDEEDGKWTLDFFKEADSSDEYPYECVGGRYRYCIPYEGNKYLAFTTRSADSPMQCGDYVHVRNSEDASWVNAIFVEYTNGYYAVYDGKSDTPVQYKYCELCNWYVKKTKTIEYAFEPFDRVLVRKDDNDYWVPAFFAYKRTDNDYHIVGNNECYGQCIPYEANKYLVNTNDSFDRDFEFGDLVRARQEKGVPWCNGIFIRRVITLNGVSFTVLCGINSCFSYKYCRKCNWK